MCHDNDEALKYRYFAHSWATISFKKEHVLYIHMYFKATSCFHRISVETQSNYRSSVKIDCSSKCSCCQSTVGTRTGLCREYRMIIISRLINTGNATTVTILTAMLFRVNLSSKKRCIQVCLWHYMHRVLEGISRPCGAWTCSSAYCNGRDAQVTLT